MPWNTEATSSVRGRLARHLGRLQQSLSALGEQVREAVSKAVGRTVAEAVGEAVYEALDHSDGQTRPHPSSPTRFSDRPQNTRQDWDGPWGQQGEESSWRDPYDRDEYDDPRYDNEPEVKPALPANDDLHAGRWRQAVAAGLQAAAWCLQRRPGRVSLLAALAVGVVAGLAVLVCHVSGVAGLVASALGLAYLLDLVRSAGTFFGQADTL